MKKKFIKFLKENNALIPFICNLSLRDKPPLFKYLNRRTPYNYITAGFKWTGTEEGNLYWWNLSKDWHRHIE